jgi:hypothetical protein
MPVYSTGGNGSVVLLTGSTDATNFIGVSDFYAKITNNRLDYARAHGTHFSMTLTQATSLWLWIYRRTF